ncbi:MAG TPA: GNAT family N-acetyltransferase [candidate division Zixibacteria bacterium]|nr:GNAT family N-acetyltransferase [candidate division Zixibacteria bacterium]
MKISRYDLDRFDPSVLSALTEGSFFASSGFLGLWESIGGHPVVWSAELGGETLAVAPGIEFGMRPVKRFQAMPDGCYGQIYFAGSITPDEREKIAGLFSEVLVQAEYVKLFLFDYYKTFAQTLDMEVQLCTTQLVDISVSDWAPPDKKLRSEIRKAEREGTKVVPFDTSVHMNRFLELMKQTEERHQRKPKYPTEFFQALAELASKDPRVVWTWCEYEENAVSSHINFIEKDMVLNWQVYFDKSYSFLKPNQQMLYSLAHEAAESGLKYLNLGASPPDAESLSSYKDKWGARTYQYNCYSTLKLLGRLV